MINYRPRYFGVTPSAVHLTFNPSINARFTFRWMSRDNRLSRLKPGRGGGGSNVRDPSGKLRHVPAPSDRYLTLQDHHGDFSHIRAICITAFCIYSDAHLSFPSATKSIAIAARNCGFDRDALNPLKTICLHLRYCSTQPCQTASKLLLYLIIRHLRHGT